MTVARLTSVTLRLARISYFTRAQHVTGGRISPSSGLSSSINPSETFPKKTLCTPSAGSMPIHSPSRAWLIVTMALRHRMRPLAATLRIVNSSGYRICASRRGKAFDDAT